MDRREFLKVVAAGAAAVSFPLAWGRPADSAVVLVDWFDSTFKAGFGAPWAFVEARPAEYEESLDRPETWGTPRDYSKLTAYHTYVVVAPDEAVGVAEMQNMFAGLVASFPAIKGSPLWWRLPARVEVKPWSRTEPGRVLLTAEQVADGAELPDVEGAEFKWDGNYAMPDVSIQCVRVRTRVAIPALQALGKQASRSYAQGGWSTELHLPLLKPEGIPAVEV